MRLSFVVATLGLLATRIVYYLGLNRRVDSALPMETMFRLDKRSEVDLCEFLAVQIFLSLYFLDDIVGDKLVSQLLIVLLQCRVHAFAIGGGQPKEIVKSVANEKFAATGVER